MAVDSLMEAANQLQKAHHAFADKLMGRTDVPEHHSVDQFFQTVKAAADVQVRTCVYMHHAYTREGMHAAGGHCGSRQHSRGTDAGVPVASRGCVAQLALKTG